MTKTNKILSYVLITLLLVVVATVGKNSVTTEGRLDNNQNIKASPVKVVLDDKKVEFSEKPIIEQNKVYVPVKEFAKKIEATTKFKGSEKIIIKKDDKNLVVNTKDHTAITEDNESFFVDSIGKGKETMLPLDVIAGHFGYEVDELKEDTIKVCSIVEDKKDKKRVNSKKEELNKEQANKETNKDKANIEKEDSKEKSNPPVQEEEVEEGKKIAYLTFDDGPNANTPRILDILKEKNVKATFFMLGSSIMSHEDITKRINDEEHGLGVHSMTHNFKSVYANPYSFLNEMNSTNDLLFKVTGQRTLLLRAPYGSKPYMKEEFRDLTSSWGYRIWDWNVDSKDSIRKNTTADEVYTEVINQLANKDKAVILFHDKEHTAEALTRIIDYLVENGFELRKIDKKMTPINFWNDIR